MRPPAALVVSLDFELHWGVLDSQTLEHYGANLRGAREVVPRLLDLFAEFEVHATWATVGLLFCASKEELLALMPGNRPTYADRRLAPDGVIASLGADERSDPLHYAASLIERIAGTPHQEVATHTFSHYYCLEPGQTRDQFEADLDAAVQVAALRGVALRSIVFPRNEVNPDYLPSCRQRGLVAYRGNPAGWMYSSRAASRESPLRRAGRLADALARRAPARVHRAPVARDGMVDVPASRFFRPRSRAPLDRLRLRRALGELDTAAATGTLYHLWWHPHNFGVDQEAHLADLRAMLERYAHRRSEGRMESLAMSEAADRALSASPAA